RSSTQTPPALKENGRPVAGLRATSLGSSKSLVACIDRSRSMNGQAFVDATNGARSFIAAKTPADRVAVCAFGSEAITLTRFSTSTTDSDSALRQLAVDAVPGTALYDAIVMTSNMLSGETNQARVLVVLTDGANSAPSGATLDDAIHAAQ